MEDAMTDSKKVPSKGGSKGGTRFPRLELKKAHEYSKKLVSKTHTGAQPANVILPGVFGSAGPNGQVRASALKQYCLLGGTSKAYVATELAQNLNGSTPEDLSMYLKEAFLKPTLFRTLFDTFCNDTVTRAKIKQQASNLKVHPDTLDECINIFIDSAIYAGLATENSEGVEMHSAPIQQQQEEQVDDEISLEDVIEENAEDNSSNTDENHAANQQTANNPPSVNSGKQKSTIDIKIDPSMDPEKLDKLLAVLQKYGQI